MQNNNTYPLISLGQFSPFLTLLRKLFRCHDVLMHNVFQDVEGNDGHT